MNFSSKDNNLDLNEKIILSLINNNNENPFILKKMFKSNTKRNKKNLKLSNKIKFKKNKTSNKTNTYSNLENESETFSFFNKNKIKNQNLSNEIEKNCNRIILKDLLSNKKNILKRKSININKPNCNKFNKKIKKDQKHWYKIRINSARPLILDYNKRFKELQKIINYDYSPKILAFKENILVHEKNISLYDNIDTKDKIISNNNIKKTDINSSLTNSPKIDSKFKRPKSAVYGFNKEKNNLLYHNLELNDNSLNNQENNKKNKKFSQSKLYNLCNGQYYDLSCTNSFIFSKKNKFNEDDKKNKLHNSPFDYLYKSHSRKKALFENNKISEHFYTKFDGLLNSEMKLYKKINRGHMFRRRPIPIFDEKYLINLPKDIKKDIRNKYNFFSYLLTENIYYNSAKNKNLYNFKKSKQIINNNIINYNINKKIHNNTENNINQEENLLKNYKINCKKEEEFMCYLKDLDYTKKHPKKKKINNNNNIMEKNNIYRPVKLKVDNSTSIKLVYRNGKKVADKNIEASDEENDFCQKIKSQPFLTKEE